MSIIKMKNEIELMYEFGKLFVLCYREIVKMMKLGIIIKEINMFVEVYLEQYGVMFEQKGYNGYLYVICVFVNDEMCYVFLVDVFLIEGDIVIIDMVVNLNGGFLDFVWMYRVGKVFDEVEKLLLVVENVLYKGIDQVVIGNYVGDIGYVIESYVINEGFFVVRDFMGYGIGKEIYEELVIFYFGK